MLKKLRLLFWLPLIVLLAAFQPATPEVCEQVIRTTLQATQSACTGLGRNQACYGNPLLEALTQPGFDDIQFENIGDIIDITGLQSLRLSAMDLDAGLWGVALMQFQANIPHQLETQNVTMVLFGDVEVQNKVTAPHLVAMRPRTFGNVNVRRYPDRSAYVLGTLGQNQIAIADGQLEDGSWYHVQLVETGERGWVFAGSVEAVGNPEPLRVVDILSAEFGPMQAFYLRTGDSGPDCAEAPEDGILIQTPEGVASVDLWINEVKIRLGSTAFVAAQPGGDLTIRLVEGATQVEALGVDQVAVAGTELNIPMTNNLQPAAPPSLPQPYSAESVAAIPVNVLERPIEIAPPLDATTLEALNSANRADAETPTPLPPTNPAVSTPAPVTSMPLPTSTIIPSSTPVPPTFTPVPTATRVPPTFTPVPTATDIPPTATNVPPTEVPTEAPTLVPLIAPSETPDPTATP